MQSVLRVYPAPTYVHMYVLSNRQKVTLHVALQSGVLVKWCEWCKYKLCRSWKKLSSVQLFNCWSIANETWKWLEILSFCVHANRHHSLHTHTACLHKRNNPFSNRVLVVLSTQKYISIYLLKIFDVGCARWFILRPSLFHFFNFFVSGLAYSHRTQQRTESFPSTSPRHNFHNDNVIEWKWHVHGIRSLCAKMV